MLYLAHGSCAQYLPLPRWFRAGRSAWGAHDGCRTSSPVAAALPWPLWLCPLLLQLLQWIYQRRIRWLRQQQQLLRKNQHLTVLCRVIQHWFNGQSCFLCVIERCVAEYTELSALLHMQRQGGGAALVSGTCLSRHIEAIWLSLSVQQCLT